MALAMGVFLLIDRREMMRVLKVFGLTLGQILVSGAGVWLVYKMDVWWMNLLWLVVMLTLSGGLCLYKIRGQLKKLALPIAAAMAVPCARPSFSVVCTFLLRKGASIAISSGRKLSMIPVTRS